MARPNTSKTREQLGIMNAFGVTIRQARLLWWPLTLCRTELAQATLVSQCVGKGTGRAHNEPMLMGREGATLVEGGYTITIRKNPHNAPHTRADVLAVYRAGRKAS